MGLKETFQNKTKEISESGSWDKVKTGYKKVETGVWKGLEPVGRWSNKQAGKLGMESFWPTEMNLECDKAARILKTFTDKGATVEIPSSSTPTSPTSSTAPTTNDEDGAIIPPDQSQTGKKPSDPHKHDSKKTQKVIKKISPKVLSEAKGIAIFTMFRTGLGLSGAGGSGVVLKRLPDGSWSGPSGILLHTIGYGFLVGLDIYDVVLVLRTEKAVQAFEKPKISLGGELSVTAGPVGNGVMLDSGIEASPCWSYVKSKGFYAGVQLDGNIILQRGDENARFYNEKADVSEILNGRFNSNNNDSLPKGALPLLQTLYASEGRPGVLGLDLVPKNDQVVAPSDLYNNDSTQGQGHVENQPQAQGQSSQYKQDPQYADQPQHVGESGQYQAPSYPPDDVEQGSSTDPNQPLPAYQDQSSVSQSPFADPQNATPQNSAAYPPEKTGH